MHKSGGMLPHGGRLSLMEKQNNKEENAIMSKIVNEAKIKNPFIAKIRELLEHRAFWLYLLVDEAEKRGLDPTDFASAAITRCGISQGNDLVKKGGTKSLKGLKRPSLPRRPGGYLKWTWWKARMTPCTSISITAPW